MFTFAKNQSESITDQIGMFTSGRFMMVNGELMVNKLVNDDPETFGRYRFDSGVQQISSNFPGPAVTFETSVDLNDSGWPCRRSPFLCAVPISNGA